MAQYDGSIRIGTGIDTKGFRDGEKELEAESRRVAKSVSSSIKEMEKEFQSLDKSMLKTAQEITSLTLKMNEMRDLHIPTKEYTEAQKEVDKYSDALQRAKDRMDKLQELGVTRGSSRFESARYDIALLENKLLDAEEVVKRLEQEGKAFTVGSDTNEFANISNQIEDLTQKLSNDRERASEIQSEIQSKLEAEAAEEERLAQIREDAVVGNQRIVEVIERRKQLLQEIADLEKAGVGGGHQQYDSARQELAALDQEIKDHNNRTTEMRDSYTRLGDSVKNAFATMGKGLIDIPVAGVKAGISGLASMFQKLGSTVSKTASGVFRSFGNMAKNAISSLISSLKRTTSSMLGFGKSTKSTSSILNGSLKNILKYGLGIRSLYALVNKMRTAIKEGFGNLYNENERLKNSVDSLKASMLTLKNTFASAFAPIVETAIPYIQRLVEWLSKAADSSGQLIAALMGRKSYTKAIKQSTAALKEETKAQNKQLSSLDKLNNLTSNKDSGADDTGSGTMFEEVPISDKWKNIADWLKDMWENSDFYELGKMLGDKLAKTLANIPWDKIKENARKLGKSLATLINGFIEGEFDRISVGWWIGRTLAEGINTGFEFLNAFVHNLNWAGVGKFIAETINGFFQNIDWDLIYDTFTTAAKGLSDLINNFTNTLDWDAIATSISNFFNTLIDTLYIFITETDWISLAQKVGKAISDAFTGIDWTKAGQTVGEAFKAFFNFIATTIENIDWWAVGESVKNFLVGIDWNGVFDALCEAIGAAFGGLMAFLGGLLANAVVDSVDYFKDKIEEAGGDVVEGILVGIAEALVGIGEWIKEHIFKPFMDGFKKAFEIHSPSKVMKDMGKFIVDGLLGGLKEKWGDVVSWITDKIRWLKEKLSGIGGSVKSAFGFGGGSSSGRSVSSSYGLRTASPYSLNPALANLSNVEFPAYATGQVIPTSMKQHLAWLGDNKKETEVVSPISTIKQALREEAISLGLVGANNGQEINLNLTVECEGYKLLELMQKLDREFFKQSGRHAFT